jgi:hypothetical protein
MDEKARRARMQKRFDQLSRKLDLYEETHEFCSAICWGFPDVDRLSCWENSDDLSLAEVLVYEFKSQLEEGGILTNLTRERDEARQERDEARTQLQAIGRKSFWAARPRKQ